MQFLYPLNGGRISQQFIPNTHGGIDYAIVVGTPVYATQDGMAVYYDHTDSKQKNYGIHQRLTHEDGSMTIYGHLNEGPQYRNEFVAAGTLIGYSGNTGTSTGPHLHFELRQRNNPVDPQPLLTLKPSEFMRAIENVERELDELKEKTIQRAIVIWVDEDGLHWHIELDKNDKPIKRHRIGDGRKVEALLMAISTRQENEVVYALDEGERF